MKTKNIQLGDKIKIIDDGEVYALFESFANFIIKFWSSHAVTWKIGDSPNIRHKFVVYKIVYHPLNGKQLAIIKRPKGTQFYIIGIDGVDKE